MHIIRVFCSFFGCLSSAIEAAQLFLTPGLPKHTVATSQTQLITYSGLKKITTVSVPHVGHNSIKLTMLRRLAQKLSFTKCTVVQGKE